MFRTFFSYEPGAVFSEYHTSHIVALVVFLLICAALWVFRQKLRSLPGRTEQRFRVGFAVTALLLEIGFKCWLIVHGKFNLSEILSLELCYITLLLTMAAAITASELLFRISYFWWFGGILSLLFPEMGEYVYGPDRFRYYHFFLIHSSFVWMNLYLLWVKGFRIDRQALKNSAMVLFAVVAAARILDGLLGLNFMFLIEPPFSAPFIDRIVAFSPNLYLGLFLVLMALFGLAVSMIPLVIRRTEMKYGLITRQAIVRRA